MIRVLIVDDELLLRKGIQALIDGESDMQVVGMLANGEEVLKELDAIKPDIILMDIHMPRLDGIKTTVKLKQMNSNVKVIFLTANISEEEVIRGISAGGDGFLVKEIYPDDLFRSIRDIHRGQHVLSYDVAKILVKSIRKLSLNKCQLLAKRLENHGLSFTKRELEVACHLVEGLDNRQIAQKLYLGEGTVKNYISEIYQKLNVRYRDEAIQFIERLLR
ncbi:response regulator transcription factor [Ornithinibacillus gellani]|uniref:response regulator n=1 Tax=Ornithinibacillus gellani TaxID=2293253 RepID=UPI0011AB792F|nr:response regulator transcription factor [Ornithinibacillus gellani]TQS71173.1 response regulator transcription factor [Ornithinibacillus gellani]